MTTSVGAEWVKDAVFHAIFFDSFARSGRAKAQRIMGGRHTRVRDPTSPAFRRLCKKGCQPLRQDPTRYPRREL